MTEKIKEEVLQVRATGRTNMFDVNAVQRIAYELELHDLVLFLEEKRNWGPYVRLILTGETGNI